MIMKKAISLPPLQNKAKSADGPGHPQRVTVAVLRGREGRTLPQPQNVGNTAVKKAVSTGARMSMRNRMIMMVEDKVVRHPRENATVDLDQDPTREGDEIMQGQQC